HVLDPRRQRGTRGGRLSRRGRGGTPPSGQGRGAPGFHRTAEPETDHRPMTNRDPKSDQPGYRGALPTRDDRLARPMILAGFVIFIAVIVLSYLEAPPRFVPAPTPLPIPSIPATPAPEATE